MKLLLLLIVAALAIVLGSQASAWRRASFALAQAAKIYRAAEHATIPEDGLAVSDDMIAEFEPPFVAWRKRTAIFLTLTAAAMAVVFFPWYWGIATFLILLLLVEALRILSLPRPDDIYYVAQLLPDFEKRAEMAATFRAPSAPELQETARILRRIFEGRTKKSTQQSQYGPPATLPAKAPGEARHPRSNEPQTTWFANKRG